MLVDLGTLMRVRALRLLPADWDGTFEVHLGGKTGEALLLAGWVPALRAQLPRARIVLHTLAPYAALFEHVASDCHPDEIVGVTPKRATLAESATAMSGETSKNPVTFSADRRSVRVNPYRLHGNATAGWVQTFGDALGVGDRPWTRPTWTKAPSVSEPYALALASSNAHSSKRRLLPFRPPQWAELAAALTGHGIRCLATGSPEDPKPASMPGWEWIDCPLIEATALAIGARYAVGWQSGITIAAAALGSGHVALIDEVRHGWPRPCLFAKEHLSKTIDLTRYEEIVIPSTGQRDAAAFSLALRVAALVG